MIFFKTWGEFGDVRTSAYVWRMSTPIAATCLQAATYSLQGGRETGSRIRLEDACVPVLKIQRNDNSARPR